MEHGQSPSQQSPSQQHLKEPNTAYRYYENAVLIAAVGNIKGGGVSENQFPFHRFPTAQHPSVALGHTVLLHRCPLAVVELPDTAAIVMSSWAFKMESYSVSFENESRPR